MKNLLILFLAVWVAVIASPETVTAFERTGTVVTTMTSGQYTYLEVQTAGGKYWAAAPRMELSVGDQVDVAPGSEMKDFLSPSLNRKFDTIVFTSSVKVIGKGASSKPRPSKPSTGKTDAKPKGIKTVEQVYAERDSLDGKQVQVRGTVVKVNTGILGKNFIHIQDGSGKAGTNDLTVTSTQMVKVGDTILATGTVTKDKDLGAGYSFKAILEDAALQVE